MHRPGPAEPEAEADTGATEGPRQSDVARTPEEARAFAAGAEEDEAPEPSAPFGPVARQALLASIHADDFTAVAGDIANAYLQAPLRSCCGSVQ